MNPFDYVNAISYTKENIIVDDISEKGYNAFITNRHFSRFQDSVMFANEMNRCWHCDNKLQFDFLRHTLRSRKRFYKNPKKEKKDSDALEALKFFYQYSNRRAHEALDILSEDQIKSLIQQYNVVKSGKHK